MLEKLLRDLEEIRKENEKNAKKLNHALERFERTNDELVKYYVQRSRMEADKLKVLKGL